jgi:hypothetical protein
MLAVGVAAGLVGLVCAFNALIDPYGMYRFVVVDRLNRHKPAVYHRVRLLKAYEVRRLRPGAIVLGTSRSHLAIRPSHDGWDPAGRPAYNLAFDGATTKEMYHYLRHAHAVRPLCQVLLGLDTYHPTPAPASVRPDFDPKLLDGGDGPALPRLARRVAADLRLLASVDTLRESVHTLQVQHQPPTEWFAPDGQRLGAVFFREWDGAFRRLGPRGYFEDIDRKEVGWKLEGRAPARDPSTAPRRGPPPAPPDPETSLGYIGKIVAFCREQGIDLRVFLTPAHAHQLELARLVGEWPALEQAKRALVALLAADAAAHPGSEPVPLWDFSGYSVITTESLPVPGTGDELRYYWDSSHAKAVVGDLVLDRLFGISRAQRAIPEDFGMRLTPDTVGAALARVRADGEVYRSTHPDEVEALRVVVLEGFRAVGLEPPPEAQR